MKELLTLSSNLTITNIAIMSLAAVLYFLTEFKARYGSNPFSIPVWIRDNWMNVAITIVSILLYCIIVDNVTKIEAVLIGFAPNYATDRILDLMDKFKGKRE